LLSVAIKINRIAFQLGKLIVAVQSDFNSRIVRDIVGLDANLGVRSGCRGGIGKETDGGTFQRWRQAAPRGDTIPEGSLIAVYANGNQTRITGFAEPDSLSRQFHAVLWPIQVSTKGALLLLSGEHERHTFRPQVQFDATAGSEELVCGH